MQGSPLEFDFQATTPCAEEVLDAMEPYWKDHWGNPSSRQSRGGVRASAAVELAREQISSCLGMDSFRIAFTSGATEANNLALLGYAREYCAKQGQPGHLITVATEHHAVLDPLRQLTKEGFALTEITPNSDGLLTKEMLIKAFRKETFLVSVMLANNEIGVIQPIKLIVEACRSRGIKLHTDASQAIGYLPFNLEDLDIDLMSISGHKIYGPKGIGCLIYKPEISLMPLQWGGGQEESLRPGTLPVPLVVGLAKAVEIAYRDLSLNQEKLAFLRNKLWQGLKIRIPDLVLNGSLNNRLPHNLNITVPGVKGHHLHAELRPFISCSSGSACSNGEPSHVLLALGRSKSEASASLRFSIGRDSNSSEIDRVIQILVKIVDRLRAY